ncbi:ricin-type beta-trefoil lectin domain protein [Lentzea sp. NPDC051838]|uniref:ricin-type beta-trefoil lectin domain protein n=1 Tax=Lentzea sp. NPDC051838 TaxID=3154849 RepID=UPI003429B022
MKSPSFRRASIGVFASAALILAGTAASAVGGGTTVGTGEHRYVAKIQSPSGACTGSLVAPLWVVTAKNCVPHNADGTPVAPVTLTIGRGDLTGTAGRVQQATLVVPRADRDLALVKLSIPVVDVPVLPIATTAPATGATVRVIGYGRTADTWAPDKAAIAPFTVGALSTATFAVTSPSAQDTCKGDAGGPALAGEQLAGITSTSWQHGCLSVTETRHGGTQVRVDDIAPWIKETVVAPFGAFVGKGDKCVDNPNAYIANGNKTQYFGCNGTDGQSWSVRADQQIQMKQRCLDVDGGSDANGTKIQIMGCNGTAAQTFKPGPDGDGSIRVLGKCLDVRDGTNANGSKIQLFDCNGSAAQRFTKYEDGSLRVFDRCVDLPGAMVNDGLQLQIFDCNGTAAQRFPSVLRVSGAPVLTEARCLSASGGGTADGTGIEIFDCLGGPGRQWVPKDDGTIVHPASGKCLELRDGMIADGTLLQLFSCNGTEAQKWKIAV